MFNKIAFIGAGSMAEAFISGIIKTGFLQSDQIVVTNNNNQARLDLLHDRYRIQTIHDKRIVLEGADLIVLSVKPYDIKSAVDSIKQYIKPNQLIVSVVAGVSTDYISKLIGQAIPVIRAMPNTSASIGFSATAITKGINATEKHIEQSEDLFKTIGTTVIVNEKDMDAVTGVSGSGPAYVYYLVEAIEKAAMEVGLDETVAKSLITQTIIGAGEMLKHSGETAETLRKNVTSPAGTTEAGIKALEKYDFQKAMVECIKSACNRSAELGKGM